MAVDIFKLVGSVFIDTDKANQSLQKTDDKATSFASTLGTVAKGALGVASTVIGVGTAVVGAATKVTDSVAEQADTIDKASIRMGISAEKYQELAYAAGQCGVEMSTLEGAAKKLEGTDINFDDAIASIMSLQTAEERSAAASELFGEKIAYTMAPLLEQSGESFDGLTQRAHDLGIVMSEDAVKAGVEFGDLFSDLKQSASALFTALGSALMPIMIDIINQLLEFMPQIQAFMGELAPVLADVVAAILPILFEMLKAILPTLMEIVEAILPLLVDTIMNLLPLIQAILPILPSLTSLLMIVLQPLIQLLNLVLPPLIALLTNIINVIVPTLNAAIKLVGNVVDVVLGAITKNLGNMLTNAISGLEGIIKFLKGVFTGNWELALEGIVQIAKSSLNGIIIYVEAVINSVIMMINAIIAAATTVANLVPGVDIDVSSARIPDVNLPRLAKGGIITEEGQAIVGEKGQELVTLPKGASVTPLPQTNTLTKEDITSAFVEALQTVGLQVTINPNTKNLFDEVVAQNTVYKRTHGGLSAL